MASDESSLGESRIKLEICSELEARVLANGKLLGIVKASLIISLAFLSTPSFADEAAVLRFNSELVGKTQTVWLRTQWTFNNLSELEGDRFFQVAQELERLGFFFSTTVINPPYQERENYWKKVDEDRERDCEAQRQEADRLYKPGMLRRLVICTGANRNTIGEKKIPKFVMTFATRSTKATGRNDGAWGTFDIGFVDEVKVISVRRSERSGCDWDARVRTWYKTNGQSPFVLSAIQKVTGRESLDQENCYFLDRDGLKWKLQNAILD